MAERGWLGQGACCSERALFGERKFRRGSGGGRPEEPTLSINIKRCVENGNRGLGHVRILARLPTRTLRRWNGANLGGPMNRIFVQLAVNAALMGLATLAMAQEGGGAPATKDAATIAADAGVLRDFGGYRAFTRPSRDATMGFSQPTQVQEILVKGGQSVKAGDLLIRGDDREDQALLKLQKMRAETDLPIKGAKAAMDLADVEYKRLQEASAKGGASPQELDRARLTLERATVEYQQAILNQRQEVVQIERLDARIVHLRLQAPFDGQIDNIQVDAGQSVSENDKVIRLVNVDLLWIDVPASMLEAATQTVKDGDKAWVLVEAGGKFRMIEGKVIEVSPVADFSSRTRRVRVEVANPAGAQRLVAGDPAWVRFTVPGEGVLKKVAEKTDGRGQMAEGRSNGK